MRTSLPKIALVSQVQEVTMQNLENVAKVLQKQLRNHFAPIWGNSAEVFAFDLEDGNRHLREIPGDPYIIRVAGSIQTKPGEPARPANVHGEHETRGKKTYAQVVYTGNRGWTRTASHECLEMVCNPALGVFRKGPSPDPADDGREVDFMCEVCDPCSAVHYEIDGISVSDFVTPAYFDAVQPPGARLTHCGAVERPLQVLKDGYLTWSHPTRPGFLRQQLVDGRGQAHFRDVPLDDIGRGASRTSLYRDLAIDPGTRALMF